MTIVSFLVSLREDKELNTLLLVLTLASEVGRKVFRPVPGLSSGDPYRSQVSGLRLGVFPKLCFSSIVITPSSHILFST